MGFTGQDRVRRVRNTAILAFGAIFSFSLQFFMLMPYLCKVFYLLFPTMASCTCYNKLPLDVNLPGSCATLMLEVLPEDVGGRFL